MPATYEVLEGVIQQQGINDSGFKLLDRWVNYDQQYEGRHPKPGERVKVRVPNGRYIVALVGADQELPPESQPPQRTGSAFRSPEEERRGVRQACLQAAVGWTWGGSGPSPKPRSQTASRRGGRRVPTSSSSPSAWRLGSTGEPR
jgi:hypothetical protein